MSVIKQFTKQETMALTGATSNQLQYLERSELVKPTREWNGKKKPDVYYTWQQVLEIKAIRNLRETTSLQVIRKILDFFEKYQIDKSLRNKQIIAINEEVFWVNHDWSNLKEQVPILKVGDKRGKGIGQYMLLVVPAFEDIVNEIWETAKNSQVIDIEQFKRKAKNKPELAA